MRTTVDIDDPILDEVKRKAAAEGISLGKAVSRYLAEALANHPDTEADPPCFTWHSAALSAQINFADKDALYSALDKDDLS